jgi:hypothetical protein
MTIEINDTTEFSNKLAYFFTAIQKLESAGFDTDPVFFESMVDDFLVQFEATTMARVEPLTAGYIVVSPQNGTIPFDFRGHLYHSEALALLGIENFLAGRDYGKVSDYRIIEVTYYA